MRVEEQRRILVFLEGQMLKIGQAIKSEERQIGCLIEYKDSLISAIVTGQVDIRNIPIDGFAPANLVSESEDDTAEEDAINESEA